MLRWLALAALCLVSPAAAQDIAPVAPAPILPAPTAKEQFGDPLIIAHRGASGERPEHTLAAYERAIDQGADYIEIDLVPTSDGALIARHENELSDTTNVVFAGGFSDRRRAKEIDGRRVTGYFAEDFTLAELRTLRAKERLPYLRQANARFDGLYPVPTLEEIVTLVRAKEAETGRRVGLYIELKHTDFLLQGAGIDSVDLLLLELGRLGVRASDPVFLQSFEVAPLRRLKQRSGFKLVQLLAREGGPADAPAMRYADMASASGLAEIATYADAIGPDLRMVLEEDGTPSALVTLAHAAGLKVHGWTLRREAQFLPAQLGGDMAKLQRILMRAGVDGLFTDNPAEAVAARR